MLILALAGAAGYYWYMQQQVTRDYEETIAELRAQMGQKASNEALASGLEPLRGDLGQLERKIGELQLENKALSEASENYTNYTAATRMTGNWPRSNT